MDYRDERDPGFREVRGGRHGQDPLEDLIYEFRRRFKWTNGPGTPPPRILALIALAVFALVGLLTSIYTVDVSEEGVVTRFERYHKTTSPGLHFRLPFWIDRVIKVPSKVLLQEEFGFRTVDSGRERTQYAKGGYLGESLMVTGDLNVADVEWIVQYRIADPWKFLFHARHVQKNIRDVTMSIMRRVVGDRLVGEVLTVGRVEIADEAKRLVQEVLDRYDMGIQVAAIVLQDVTPPESVKTAFNDVNAAKQEQEKAINVAEREYNNIIPEAKGKAEQLVADAEAYSVALVNRAKGDASRFNSMLTEYRRAPDVTRRRLYVEAMEDIFSNMEKLVIVDSKVKGVLPLYPNPPAVAPIPPDMTAKEASNE